MNASVDLPVTGLVVEARVENAFGVTSLVVTSLGLKPRMWANPDKDDIAAEGEIDAPGGPLSVTLREGTDRVAMVAERADGEELTDNAVGVARERLTGALTAAGVPEDRIGSLRLRAVPIEEAEPLTVQPRIEVRVAEAPLEKRKPAVAGQE